MHALAKHPDHKKINLKPTSAWWILVCWESVAAIENRELSGIYEANDNVELLVSFHVTDTLFLDSFECRVHSCLLVYILAELHWY